METILNKELLLQGNVQSFTNEDEALDAIVDVKQTATKKEFRVWFNGAFVLLTKRIDIAEKKINELISKFNLTEE